MTREEAIHEATRHLVNVVYWVLSLDAIDQDTLTSLECEEWGETWKVAIDNLRAAVDAADSQLRIRGEKP